MIEISDHAELAARCNDDTLCLWAAQGLVRRPWADSTDPSRAWRSADGTAVAVAGHDLSTRNRIAVLGSAEEATPLVHSVLEVVGPAFRPIGDRDLIDAIVAGLPELTGVASFGWMDSRGPTPDRLGPAGAHWLSERELPDVTALLQVSFPDSDAQPGAQGVERWAGVRDGQGRLLAVTAAAWSAPDVGYLAGVAVHPEARGQGYGAAVCGFVLAAELAAHGAAALMVEEDNHSAIRLYRSLGMSYRALTAAAVTGPVPTNMTSPTMGRTPPG
jgi:GNAT superfamily N-acetyltransferase